nr:MAG TPA: hypothetical protein [Caudoviricetes sp.]
MPKRDKALKGARAVTPMTMDYRETPLETEEHNERQHKTST